MTLIPSCETQNCLQFILSGDVLLQLILTSIVKGERELLTKGGKLHNRHPGNNDTQTPPIVGTQSMSSDHLGGHLIRSRSTQGPCHIKWGNVIDKSHVKISTPTIESHT